MVLICALQNHNYSAATIATTTEDEVDDERRFQYVHIIHTYIYNFFVHSFFFPFPFLYLPALFSCLKFPSFSFSYTSPVLSSTTIITLLALQMWKLREKGWIWCVHMARSVSMLKFYVPLRCSYLLRSALCIRFEHWNRSYTYGLLLPTTYSEISRYIVVVLIFIPFFVKEQ